MENIEEIKDLDDIDNWEIPEENKGECTCSKDARVCEIMLEYDYWLMKSLRKATQTIGWKTLEFLEIEVKQAQWKQEISVN